MWFKCDSLSAFKIKKKSFLFSLMGMRYLVIECAASGDLSHKLSLVAMKDDELSENILSHKVKPYLLNTWIFNNLSNLWFVILRPRIIFFQILKEFGSSPLKDTSKHLQ